jgi:hypothetical protein
MAVTTVADNASSVTVLASNASRKSAEIYNDSAATLYLLLANDTASSSKFTAKLPAGAFFIVPFGYTGIVVGIWSSAPGGFARVTED